MGLANAHEFGAWNVGFSLRYEVQHKKQTEDAEEPVQFPRFSGQSHEHGADDASTRDFLSDLKVERNQARCR